MEPNPTVIRSAGDDFLIATTPSGHAQVVELRGERKAAAAPLELFISGLGSCTAADVLSILKKKRERVTDYRVEIRTTRRTEHPRSFERIEVKHIVRGYKVSEASVARAVELSTTTYCGAINTVRPTAQVVTSYEIQEEPAAE